nr:YodL domain-containing protein [Clostridioides sp.]
MSSIEMKKACIIYYGNPAGYVKENIATIDEMFRSKEFEKWLSEKGLKTIWKDGVFEKLSSGKKIAELNKDIEPLKNVRIWQLRSNSDFDLRFISYDEVLKSFGEPDKENYELVYDGEIESNDLESIYTKFNLNHPIGFTGHSLSMSDVVELYDSTGSEFHYVDRFGFKKINFEPQDLTKDMNISM